MSLNYKKMTEELYTSYRVKAILKPQYVPHVQRFCDTRHWCSPDEDNVQYPQCILDWVVYQNEKNAETSQSHKTIGIPIGLPSPWWGSECIVYEGCREDSEDYDNTVYWWSFSGELKNTCGQFQHFMHHVVSEMCDEIPLCWTCREDESMFVQHKEQDIRANIEFMTI